jgi:hypothetical protein
MNRIFVLTTSDNDSDFIKEKCNGIFKGNFRSNDKYFKLNKSKIPRFNFIINSNKQVKDYNNCYILGKLYSVPIEDQKRYDYWKGFFDYDSYSINDTQKIPIEVKSVDNPNDDSIKKVFYYFNNNAQNKK